MGSKDAQQVPKQGTWWNN